MKKILTLLCAVMLLGACTKNEIIDNPIIIDTDFLIGTWIYDTEENTPMPTSKYEIEIFKANGNYTYCYPDEGKWNVEDYKYTINDNIITFSDGSKYKILYLSNTSLTIESLDSGGKWTARKATTDISKKLIGKWSVTEGYPAKFIEYNEDGTHTTDIGNGKWFCYGDFHVLESSNGNVFGANVSLDWDNNLQRLVMNATVVKTDMSKNTIKAIKEAAPL